MSAYYRKRLLILLATIVTCALFIMVGRWSRTPIFPGFETSLSVMPGAAGRAAVVFVTLVAAAAIAAVIAGRVRTEASLFAAAVGLCALSVQGGPMRYVWIHDDMVGLGYRLAVELALLGVTMAAIWVALTTVATRLLRREEMSKTVDAGPVKAMHSRWASQGMAFAVNVIVTGAMAMLLLASDDKKQAVCGVAVASCVGAIASVFVRAPIGNWLWSSPVAVGIVGYVAWQASGCPAPDSSAFSHLVRAAPLDYAGAGTAGAILGRWLSVTREETMLGVDVKSKDLNALSALEPQANRAEA